MGERHKWKNKVVINTTFCFIFKYSVPKFWGRPQNSVDLP